MIVKLRRFAAIAAALAVAVWIAVYFSTPGRAGRPFLIAPGDGAERIIGGLKDAGVVRSALIFKIALSSSGLATKLQPGSYDLTGAKSYREVIERLASGGMAANEVTIRILEGWTVRDIARLLNKIGLTRGAGEFYALAGEPAADFRRAKTGPRDFSEEFSFLADKPARAGLEGYLFPDTYRVFDDAKTEDIVRTMLRNFDRRLTPELRAEIAAAGRTTRDIVIMASIIEREVRTDEDRAAVSDIFWRRLKIGMPLQADSTVNYATGKSLPSVLTEDTKVDSPYNTYKYPGLPIGPIGNNGLASIIAAVEPKKNDYWFFLTDGVGAVHYARTIEEHNKNRANFLRQ